MTGNQNISTDSRTKGGKASSSHDMSKLDKMGENETQQKGDGQQFNREEQSEEVTK